MYKIVPYRYVFKSSRVGYGLMLTLQYPRIKGISKTKREGCERIYVKKYGKM
jgi:hypothetical protein